jgi:undecaprenyl-diphosphatase
MEMIKSILYNKDLKWIAFFNSRLKCRVLDKIFIPLTYVGNATNTVAICLLMIGIGNTLVRHVGVQALIVLISSHLLVQVLKRTVTRERPQDVLSDLNTYNLSLDRYSFPSGHTTAIFSIAVTVSLYIPVLAFLVLPIAVLVGLSRVYLGVHYPSDVIAGIVLAVATSVLVYHL